MTKVKYFQQIVKKQMNPLWQILALLALAIIFSKETVLTLKPHHKEVLSSPPLSFECLESDKVILNICKKMPAHMTKSQKLIISELKKNVEKFSKSISHIEYLNFCQQKEVIPKGLNLANLLKSEELWKGNEVKIMKTLHLADILPGVATNILVSKW